MKKTILTFGFLSGGVSAALMFAMVPFIDAIGFERGAIAGYTAMVISFLFVYFGIRSYRDNVLGGRIAFGRAFGVGLLITLISCACYVAAWAIVYHNFMPDFLDRYLAYVVDNLRSSGASQAAIDEAAKQGEMFKRMYSNPLIMVALSFVEPLPVGLLITAVSAAVLRRKSAP
jgi:hypothetical protein